nr:phosphotransferase [Halorhabdus tiamatea]
MATRSSKRQFWGRHTRRSTRSSPEPAAAPAVLVHGDVTQGNTLLRADGTGLIDWEDAHAGDPVRELRRTQEQLLADPGENSPTELLDALRAGYREQAGTLPAGFDDWKAIYGAVSFLDTSGFFDEWAPDVDRPTAALEDWVEREMERRLAEI